MAKKPFQKKQHNLIKINTLQNKRKLLSFTNPIQIFFYKKGIFMKTGLRSLLEPQKVQFLRRKLELGEISQEECKEIMKRLILQKFDRIENRSFRASILGFGRSLESKLTAKT